MLTLGVWLTVGCQLATGNKSNLSSQGYLSCPKLSLCRELTPICNRGKELQEEEVVTSCYYASEPSSLSLPTNRLRTGTFKGLLYWVMSAGLCLLASHSTTLLPYWSEVLCLQTRTNPEEQSQENSG